jgi:hypothetical protein
MSGLSILKLRAGLGGESGQGFKEQSWTGCDVWLGCFWAWLSSDGQPSDMTSAADIRHELGMEHVAETSIEIQLTNSTKIKTCR